MPGRSADGLRRASASQRTPKQEAARRRESQREWQRSAWRVSLALLVCLLVATAALHTLLQGFGWWFAMAGTTLTVLATSAIARGASQRRWMPTLASTIVLVVLLTVFFASGTAFLFLFPTFDTLGTLAELGQAGAVSIAGQSVPAELTAGIIFLLCLGAGALAIVADLFAVTWRFPALAAVPLAVILFVPTFIGVGLSDVFVFMVTAIAWLVLLRAGQPFPQTSRAFGLGAAAVAVALLAPMVLPQVDESQASGDAFGGYLAGVNPVLSLGSDLRRELPRTILFYSTLSGDPSYLRLVSLQNFTEATWAPDEPEIDRNNLPTRIDPPLGLAADVRVEGENTWVDVRNLGSPWLPVPYPVTAVRGLSGDWFWDAADLTLTSPNRVARGEEYTVQSLNVEPTPAQLASAGRVVPADFDQYLALPEGMPAVIASDAEEVTAAATSDYGRAVALQEFFRNGAFTYSETAPVEQGYDGSGMDVLAKFLEVKSGYCIHFASAMAVMARTLGIPSRVAVGFLPGEKETEKVDGRTQYRVTTQNVHAWPELYFEGIGWTRFEPTPGRGFVPSYADEETPGVPITPTPTSTPTPTPTPTVAPTTTAAPQDPGEAVSGAATQSAALGWLWAVIVVLGAVLLLLIPAMARRLQRAVRLRRLARGSPLAQTGWLELLQTARDLGVPLSATATPREAARVLAASAKLSEGGRRALDAVLDRVELEKFSEHGSPKSGTELTDQVMGIVRALRTAASTRARLAAAFVPRSMWEILAGLSRVG